MIKIRLINLISLINLNLFAETRESYNLITHLVEIEELKVIVYKGKRGHDIVTANNLLLIQVRLLTFYYFLCSSNYKIINYYLQQKKGK